MFMECFENEGQEQEILNQMVDMIDALDKINKWIHIEHCLCWNYTQKRIMEQVLAWDLWEDFRDLNIYMDDMFNRVYQKMWDKIFDIVPEIAIQADISKDVDAYDLSCVHFFIQEYREKLEDIDGIWIEDIINLRIFLKNLYYLIRLNRYEIDVPLHERQRRYEQQILGENLQ